MNIQVNISQINHERLMKLIQEETLLSMTMSKATVIDIALTHLFNDLNDGNSLNEYAIQHLKQTN